jgi:glycerol-3-phosphate dehydrogenase (NAD(P)+)
VAIAIVGAGQWGTALAQAFAAAGRDVSLWARDPALAESIAATRENPRYLPGLRLDAAARVSGELSDVLTGAEVVVLAVPTAGLRDVATACVPHLPPDCAVVSAAKGFERGTARRMSEVLSEVLGAGPEPAGSRVAVMSGPNIAPEIAGGLPAATVVASADPNTAARVRDALSGPQLRVYSNDDLVGVEYGGALKNVVAIAAGIADGVGAGDNGKAALITRGLAEMARLGVRAGARALTFAGLTGLGDCVVTCMSPLSRNRRLGQAIGGGMSLAEAQASTHMIAEGVDTARVALGLARNFDVEMPIVTEVCAVLFDGKPIIDALGSLMARGARDELQEFGLLD